MKPAIPMEHLDKNTKLNLFFDCKDFRIFSAPSFWPYCDAWHWAPYLKKTDYVCFLDWNPINSIEYQLRVRDAVGDNAIFLSGSENAHKMRVKHGLNSFIFSNNSLVNESIFTCMNRDLTNREFRAVYTARAAAFKRISLSSKVKDLALVINRTFASQFIELDESYQDVPSKYLNSGHLTAAQLCALYNRSRCGLILSTAEGACFTVVEYLLSGIPVVSTRPESSRGLGGRELWLTPNNSAYCEATQESVSLAVSELLSRHLDPQKIRAECISMFEEQRRVLKEDVLQPIFTRHESALDLDKLLFGPDAWLKTSSLRHRFSAEHVILPLNRAISILERKSMSFLPSTKPNTTTEQTEQIFTDIFDNDKWGGGNCKSGGGSLLPSTVVLRRELPSIFAELGIRSLIDAPCGVGTWARDLALALDWYLGVDVVQGAITAQRENTPPDNMKFEQGDIVTFDFPPADAILCRDCLVHLENDLALRAIENFRRSGAKFLLVTHYDLAENRDVITGNWRAVDMMKPPFPFSAALRIVDERESKGKKLAIFDIA